MSGFGTHLKVGVNEIGRCDSSLGFPECPRTGGSAYWRVCIIGISENPGYSPLDFTASLSPWIHLPGSSQFNPSWTLLIFLLPGSYPVHPSIRYREHRNPELVGHTQVVPDRFWINTIRVSLDHGNDVSVPGESELFLLGTLALRSGRD